nr:hypothetical protein [Tanacetum cinerariifolium]
MYRLYIRSLSVTSFFIRQGSRCVFPTFPFVSDLFKTLCFFNYALILRQDYDITSSLRRGALHIESLLNQDSSIISSFKIDSILDEFAGELILLKLIPPGIDEGDCDPEEEIRLIEKFLYDNSSPRTPEEFIFKNSDATIESFSPSPIPVEDSDSLLEEINLSLTPDDSMPPCIEDDDYDSEGDILILEELLINDSLSLPKNVSIHFDIPSSPRPPAKPRMMILLPTQPTLAFNEEKSPHLLSHRGLKAFQLSSESPMMIYEGNIPILDVLFLHFNPP